jgi:long-chain acyl-CoA synthetase
MKTVIDLLHEAARKYGSMPYLGQKHTDVYSTISFAETDELSLALAAALSRRGLGTGDNAAILSEGRASWVIGEFGLLKAGCASVPLSTKLSADEILFRLDHSEAKAILVSENNFSKAGQRSSPAAARKPQVVSHPPNGRNSWRGSAAAAGMKIGTDFVFLRMTWCRGPKTLLSGPEEEACRAARMAANRGGIEPDDTVTICYTSGNHRNPKGIHADPPATTCTTPPTPPRWWISKPAGRGLISCPWTIPSPHGGHLHLSC